MESGLEDSLAADADRLSKPELDGHLVGFDRENAGADERDDQEHHEQLDDAEAAAERIRKRDRPGILEGRRRGGGRDAGGNLGVRMPVVMRVIVRMIVGTPRAVFQSARSW